MKQENNPLKDAVELNIEPKQPKTIKVRNLILSSESGKKYTVSVRYIAITKEKAKLKRAIIERVLKTHLQSTKKPPSTKPKN